MRAANVARTGWGATLLLTPGAVLARAGISPSNPRRRYAARILGARHLVQAWIARGGDEKRLAVVASIDAVHATTAFGFAVCSRRYRRAAFLDGAIASMFAFSAATGRRSR